VVFVPGLPGRSPNNATCSARLRALRKAYRTTVLPSAVSLPWLRNRSAPTNSIPVSTNTHGSTAKATNTEMKAKRNNTTRSAVLPPSGLPHRGCTTLRAIKLCASALISWLAIATCTTWGTGRAAPWSPARTYASSGVDAP
jgi:hypothetical protein